MAHVTFFPVAPRKFAVLSVVSFAIYPIYWFYGNWKRIRASGTPIVPLWRAAMAPFYGEIGRAHV